MGQHTSEKAVSPETLEELLYLDEATGNLFWKHREPRHFAEPKRGTRQSMCDGWNRANAGQQAFCVMVKGYLVGSIFEKQFKAHRVAYALSHGQWPVGEVDHINGNRTDNRPANLRDVGRIDNARNQKRSTRNKSGQVGVHFDAARQKWVAKVCGRFVGQFHSLAEAVSARAAAAADVGLHPNHGRG